MSRWSDRDDNGVVTRYGKRVREKVREDGERKIERAGTGRAISRKTAEGRF